MAVYFLVGTHRLNQRFHVIQVTLESLTACGSQLIFGLWHSALERFRAGDVLCLFKPPRMNAEVAIRRLQQLLQFIEREALVDGQRAHDSQPHTLVDNAVEVRERMIHAMLDCKTT